MQNPRTTDQEITPSTTTTSGSEPSLSAVPIVPEQPVTSTPLPTQPPPTRPIYVVDPNAYVVDPNAQRLLSNIFMLDPDTQQIIWKLETRFLPEAVLSPDGQFLYVADSYRTHVTRGEWVDALSVYSAHSGNLLMEDVPIQGRLLYKAWPSGAHPFIFLSDDGRQLYVGKYGDPDSSKILLSAYDPETLQLVYEVIWPPCSLRIQTMPDTWLCANTDIAPESPPSAMTFSLYAVDPRRGTIEETFFTNPNLLVAGMAASLDESLIYVVTNELALLTIDMKTGKIMETKPLKHTTGWELVGDSIVLSPDGTRLYLGFDSGRDEISIYTDMISIYDTNNWELLKTISLPNSINFFSLSAMGDQLYVISLTGRRLTIYDTDTYQEIAVIKDLGGSPSTILVPKATQ